MVAHDEQNDPNDERTEQGSNSVGTGGGTGLGIPGTDELATDIGQGIATSDTGLTPTGAAYSDMAYGGAGSESPTGAAGTQTGSTALRTDESCEEGTEVDSGTSGRGVAPSGTTSVDTTGSGRPPEDRALDANRTGLGGAGAYSDTATAESEQGTGSNRTGGQGSEFSTAGDPFTGGVDRAEGATDMPMDTDSGTENSAY